MFSSGMSGAGVKDVNVRFRMYTIVTVALFAFGTLLYWRGQLFVSSDYVELPQHDRQSVKVLAGAKKR
ncbi:MAG: hypothetical protein KBD66_03645 [Candidatus Doudnabacteria bacterium]|nr:hypothetical protein [Candidatus Doudnabacteria bacterium]